MDGKNIISELKDLLAENVARRKQLETWRDQYITFYSNALESFDYPSDKECLSEVEDGDVVLLNPSLVTTGARPIKAMVLSTFANDWEKSKHICEPESVAIAPISPLPTPTFSSEYKSDEGPVVQLWNTRCIPESFLKRCWQVDKFSQNTVDNSWDIYQHWEGKPLPQRLKAKVFVPQPSDDFSLPTAYFNRESALVDDLEL